MLLSYDIGSNRDNNDNKQMMISTYSLYGEKFIYSLRDSCSILLISIQISQDVEIWKYAKCSIWNVYIPCNGNMEMKEGCSPEKNMRYVQNTCLASNMIAFKT